MNNTFPALRDNISNNSKPTPNRILLATRYVLRLTIHQKLLMCYISNILIG